MRKSSYAGSGHLTPLVEKNQAVAVNVDISNNVVSELLSVHGTADALTLRWICVCTSCVFFSTVLVFFKFEFAF